jgi:hypothetical protein
LNVSTNCLNSKMCFPTVIHWTYFLRKTTTSSQWWADLSLIGGCCVWIQFTQRIAFSIVVRCTFDFNKFLIFQCQRVSRFQHCKSHRSHQSQVTRSTRLFAFEHLWTFCVTGGNIAVRELRSGLWDFQIHFKGSQQLCGAMWSTFLLPDCWHYTFWDFEQHFCVPRKKCGMYLRNI